MGTIPMLKAKDFSTPRNRDRDVLESGALIEK